MILYPYSYPIILNDILYAEYGGDTGTSEYGVRQSAFLVAEMQVSTALETYLLPTIVTGTFMFSNPVALAHTWVNSVHLASLVDGLGNVLYTYSGTSSGMVLDDERGMLYFMYVPAMQGCVEVVVVYQAGLPTGVASQPDMLLALTKYAGVILNEIAGYGNEGVGDVGVQSFRNQAYSETRVGLIRTSFGTSAIAQFVDKLIEKYKRRRFVGL